MKEIDSPIFGKTTILDFEEDDYIKLKKLAIKYPVDAFGIVNKNLNKVGYCCSIQSIKETMNEKNLRPTFRKP